MRLRGGALKGFTGRRKGLVPERLSDDLDEAVRQAREIADRLVLDLAILAAAAAKQMRAIGLARVFACRGDYPNSPRLATMVAAEPVLQREARRPQDYVTSAGSSTFPCRMASKFRWLAVTIAL